MTEGWSGIFVPGAQQALGGPGLASGCRPHSGLRPHAHKGQEFGPLWIGGLCYCVRSLISGCDGNSLSWHPTDPKELLLLHHQISLYSFLYEKASLFLFHYLLPPTDFSSEKIQLLAVETQY